MKKRIYVFVLLFVMLEQVCVFAYSKQGSCGYEVVTIQRELKKKGYYVGKIDGIYGELTCKAVKEFQSECGIASDGIAGRKTISNLGINKYSDAELLARVINGEARGENYIGQVAVGAVVLNRVKHPSFPDTIHDVVYQKGAFSALTDGQFEKKITDSCRKAAYAALTGVDPTNGAVFYYNPATATSKWIRTRTPIKKIGNHLFCK